MKSKRKEGLRRTVLTAERHALPNDRFLLVLSLRYASERPCRSTILAFPAAVLLGGVGFECSGPGAFKSGLLVAGFFLNRHDLSMTQRKNKIESA
jgi:hypothetical protein